MEVSRRNFKHLYRDRAMNFYSQLFALANATVECCDEARKKESTLDKAVARNSAAKTENAAIDSSLSQMESNNFLQTQLELEQLYNREKRNLEESAKSLKDLRDSRTILSY